MSAQPALSTGSRLRFTAVLRGEVDGHAISLRGGGTISDGLTIGDYELEEFPGGLPPHLLPIVLVTGYPNASRALNTARNPFVGRDYEYRRRIVFSEGSTWNLHASCTTRSGVLASSFTLEGTGFPEKAGPIHPLVESWVPVGCDRIAGLFRCAWDGPDGRYVSCTAESNYQLFGTASVGVPAHRYIAIHQEVNGREFSIAQQARLFNRLPEG